MNEFKIKHILTEILFNARLCESANQQSIVDFFYDKLLLEKLLVGEPVGVPELRKILRNKILNFEFIKLDGEVRPAKGTTMMKYIPEPDHPKGIRPSSPKVATFFDMDKKAWRSVSQRSKEIVLKYAFSEKDGEKKPVFIVRDKEGEESDKEDDEDTTSSTEEPDFSEPTSTGDDEYNYVSPNAEDSEEDAFDIDPDDEYNIDDEFDFVDDDFDLDDEDPEEFDTDDGFEDNTTNTEVDDIKAVSTPKVKPVSMPQVEIDPVDNSPKYGWKIKDTHKPEDKPKIKPIVKPFVAPRIKTPTPPSMRDETEVLLPQEIKSQHPFVPTSLPTKEAPLEIESDDDEF